jgi:metal-responsive CopG/Arc/MetJ family transcriptional regulator
MSTVTLRLPDELLKEANTRAQILHLTRNEYIKKALEHMNEKIRSLEKRKRLMDVSKRVRQESIKINAEFEKIENDTNTQ